MTEDRSQPTTKRRTGAAVWRPVVAAAVAFVLAAVLAIGGASAMKWIEAGRAPRLPWSMSTLRQSLYVTPSGFRFGEDLRGYQPVDAHVSYTITYVGIGSPNVVRDEWTIQIHASSGGPRLKDPSPGELRHAISEATAAASVPMMGFPRPPASGFAESSTVTAWHGLNLVANGIAYLTGSRLRLVGSVSVCTGAALVAGAVMWHRRFRWVPGVCGECGYELAGLAPGAPCPECGGVAQAVKEGSPLETG